MADGTLRTESVSPLYAQIMERIRQDIIQGVYPAGSRIPTEHELEIRYAVSRVTVRRAMLELTTAGLLERKQGKGTFVTARKTERRERVLLGFHEACKAAGKVPSVLLTRMRELDGEPKDLELLNLPEGSRVLEIRRVLAADDEPVILQICRFSMAYAWLENAELKGSLYSLLQEYGVRAEKSIYDILLRKTNHDEAALLNVDEGTVLLAVDQVVYDQKGRLM